MISDSELRRGMLAMKIVWGSMMAALAIYLFIGLQVGKNMHISIDEDSFTIFKYVSYSLTCIILITTGYVRKFILFKNSQFLQANQVFEHPVLQKYYVAGIISWALSESVGIFGFVLFLMGKNTADLYILILIAAVVLFLYRPKKEEIISMAEKNQESSAINGTGPSI